MRNETQHIIAFNKHDARNLQILKIAPDAGENARRGESVKKLEIVPTPTRALTDAP